MFPTALGATLNDGGTDIVPELIWVPTAEMEFNGGEVGNRVGAVDRVIVIFANTDCVVVSPFSSRGTDWSFVAKSHDTPLLILVCTTRPVPTGTFAVHRTTDPVTGLPGNTNGSDCQYPINGLKAGPPLSNSAAGEIA
jgi:hypothetical protein